MDPALTPLGADPREVLRRHGIRPKKSLGQHFLVDASHLERIVAAAELRPTDVVLEVGPGVGVLTVALAERASRVVAVELDDRMRPILAEVTAGRANVEIVAADILETDPGEILGYAADAADAAGRREGYKVVANLPYYITSAVLRHLLEARVRPELAVVMVQKEVADRILAEPGEMSVLAVAVQYYAIPERVSVVPAGAFHPPPKVDSAVLRLKVRESAPVDADVGTFFRVVRAGFSQRRKQLKNSLAGGLQMSTDDATDLLERAGIEPTRRAQTLTLTEWGSLANVYGG